METGTHRADRWHDGTAAGGVLREILHTCSLAHMCLLTHLRIYSPTHVSAYHLLHYLQAEAEKISADVARTAVLSRQRHEEQKVRKATRHPAVASCVPGCNHMEPGCKHVSYLPRCSRPHTSKRSRRPRRPRRPVCCLLGGQFLLLGGQKLTPPI